MSTVRVLSNKMLLEDNRSFKRKCGAAGATMSETEPSREEIRAGVQSAVKTVLRKKKVREEDLESFLGSVMVQAHALYSEWPIV